ncbi:MAG: Zn-ribbon domain-containing OB-fold protein [Gammaproteobacteria bacterium]
MSEWYYPVVDTESEPFWNACREGRLLVKRCRSCAKVYYYPRRQCPQCWSEDTEWLECSRRGTVYSYSVVHQNPAAPFKDLCPYGTVLVDLEEGPRMMTNWDFDVPLDALRCGLPVEIAFRKVDDTLCLPIVRPRA